MRSFVFENSTKVYFGTGCVEEHLPALLEGFGRTVMLAYGGGSVKRSGVYGRITAILQKAGKEVVEFSGIMSNPTYAKVLEGAALAKERQVEAILAVGGGSVMDCAKAVSMAAVYQGDVWEDFWLRRGQVDFTPLPLGVVVTKYSPCRAPAASATAARWSPTRRRRSRRTGTTPSATPALP